MITFQQSHFKNSYIFLNSNLCGSFRFGRFEESLSTSKSDLRQLIDFIGEDKVLRSRDLSRSEIRIKLTQAFGDGLLNACFSVKALIRVFLF